MLKPRYDLMTELVQAEEEGDRLTRPELRMLAGAVLSVGTDTTRNQLAAAVQLFCDHPDQWDAMPDDAATRARVVDEVMRYSPAILGTARQTSEAVELLGVAIPADTLVSVSTAAGTVILLSTTIPIGSTSSGRSTAAPHVRRRHPLLPRRAPRQGRARRSARADEGEVADDRADGPRAGGSP